MQKHILAFLLLIPFLSSAQPITSYPYSEDFESGPGGWSSASSNFVDSWILGTPNYNVIDQAAPGGSVSWFTDTTDYETSEYSHVISPEFDFSGLNYPIISFDIWWDLVTDVDGAVFQSSTNGGGSWENVGHHDDNEAIGTNWYNHAFLSEGFPPTGAGLQQISHWSGDSTLGSQGWVNASHFLEGLGGESSVMFRFAWANRNGNANRPANNAAFDNVEIVEGPAVDLSVTALEQAGPCGGGYSGTALVTVSNLGAGNATFASFQDSLGTPFSITQITIPAFGTMQIPLELPLQNPGDTIIHVGVNHPSDQNTTNNFMTGSFNCNVINGQNHCNDFENNSVGTWFVDPEGINSSWNLGGNASNSTINTPNSGVKFWGTTGPGGGYNPDEQSSIVSPFFDFSNLQNTDVSIQLWTDLETDYDGGVLQYSLDGGSTWFNVGSQGTGTNWFNSGTLSGGGAGGQNAANWNGATAGWVNATNVTPMLDGATNVLFRVSIGADDLFQDGGIGVDDFCTAGEEEAVADTFNIVINEVKGHAFGDTAYTVELLNKESVDINLDGYKLQIYDDSVSEFENLTGTISSMGYMVIAIDVGNATMTHNRITINNAAGLVLDGLSLNYGGGMDLLPTEGSFDEELDMDYYRSVSRIPNGQDTDDNAADFKLVCPTLGSANMDDQLSCGPPEILINEIDALPGTSGYTVELFNKSPFEADLGGYIIQVYDGNSIVNETLSGTISGQGYKLVSINFANADISRNTINLFDSSENFLGQVTLNNAGATLNEQQGSFNELDLYVSESISRIPNGQNTFDNAVDFKLVCQTLGSENIDTTQDCQPASITEAHESGLMLHPNPAKNFIMLDLGNPMSFSIRLSDAMGRTSNITRTSGQGKIDISELIPGVYSIIATDTNGKSAIGRFIKQ